MSNVTAQGVLISVVAKSQDFSIGNFNAEVSALLNAVISAQSSISPLLSQGSARPQEIQAITTTLDRAQTRMSALLTDLNTYDVRRARRTQTAENDLALMAWERSARAQMATTQEQITNVITTARRLANGAQGVKHIVKASDTFQSLAALYLGSFRRWREIATLNGLPTGNIPVGTVLRIPQNG